MKGRDFKKSLVFRVYLVIVTLIIGVALLDILPQPLQKTLYTSILETNFYTNAQPWLQNILFVLSGSFIYIGIFAAVTATAFFGKRDFFELWALFVLLMLPRDKKYWGRVADQKTNKSIPFAKINLYSYEGGTKTLIASTVSDLDGRYRLHVSDTNQNNLYQEVVVDGYKPYLQRISLQYLDKASKVISDTVYLTNINTNPNTFKNLFYRISSRLYGVTLFFILAIPLFYVVVSVFFTIINPNIVGITLVVAFGITSYWNISVLTERIKVPMGKIIDNETLEPIQSALVTLYKDKSTKITAVSDHDGIIKFNVKSGDYRMQITAQNYVLSNNVGDIGIVRVGDDGYLQQDIQMVKTDTNLETTGMINPFA